MIDRALTSAADFADRHDRAISIAGAVWLALSCAAYASFLPIPEIPYLTDDRAWMVSGAWNALWWGFAHPAIDRRRKANRLDPPTQQP